MFCLAHTNTKRPQALQGLLHIPSQGVLAQSQIRMAQAQLQANAQAAQAAQAAAGFPFSMDSSAAASLLAQQNGLVNANLQYMPHPELGAYTLPMNVNQQLINSQLAAQLAYASAGAAPGGAIPISEPSMGSLSVPDLSGLNSVLSTPTLAPLPNKSSVTTEEDATALSAPPPLPNTGITAPLTLPPPPSLNGLPTPASATVGSAPTSPSADPLDLLALVALSGNAPSSVNAPAPSCIAEGADTSTKRAQAAQDSGNTAPNGKRRRKASPE